MSEQILSERAVGPKDGGCIRACLVSSIAINIKAFFRGQFSYLQRFGWQWTVVANEPTRADLELPDETRYHHVSVTRSITPWADLKSIVQLYGLFRRERFHLVQYTTPKGALLGSIAAFLAGVPVRLHLLWGIYYMGRAGWRRRLFKTLEWLACRLSTHVTFDGFELRDFAIREGLCRAANSSVVGRGGDNGIDLSLYDPARWRKAGREVRKSWGIPESSLVIGSVLRLVGDKGINELVAAFERIAADRSDVWLLLVGWLEEKDPPRPETLAVLNRHPRIVVTQFQQNVLPFYAAMDVFALATYREGFSAVNLEAAAMVLPVVTTDAIGAKESIVDGVTGIVVPVRDVRLLNDALVRLLDDVKLRQQMGMAGRERVERDFEQVAFWDCLRRHREELLIQARVLIRDRRGLKR
jgi:glycosyltransferase involved in cell wall biosynthesis